VNLALNHRDRQRSLVEEEVSLEEVASFTSSLETAKLVAAELWRKVEKHLLTLPPKQRLVVELRLFHDLPFKEIGVLAECSEASARVNFANGVGALRTVLKPPKPS
jgi:RNA polymerase sigma-70 factor (ECF subfamily)